MTGTRSTSIVALCQAGLRSGPEYLGRSELRSVAQPVSPRHATASRTFGIVPYHANLKTTVASTTFAEELRAVLPEDLPIREACIAGAALHLELILEENKK